MIDEKQCARLEGGKRSGHGLFFWIVVPLPFAVLLLCVLLFRFIVESWNYWIGAPLSLILCIAAAATMSGTIERLWIQRFENPIPSTTFATNLSFLASAVFILLTVGAWVSYALTKVGLADISGVSAEPCYIQLVSTYGWHLIDLIPFTNVERTFGMKEPLVQFNGWVGGAPILVFRLLTVVIVLTAIREAWQQFRSKSEELFVERITKAVKQDRLRKETDAPESHM